MNICFKMHTTKKNNYIVAIYNKNKITVEKFFKRFVFNETKGKEASLIFPKTFQNSISDMVENQ